MILAGFSLQEGFEVDLICDVRKMALHCSHKQNDEYLSNEHASMCDEKLLSCCLKFFYDSII